MEVMPSGSVTLAKLSHIKKAPCSILVTPDGMSMPVRAVQFENEEFPMVVSLLPSSKVTLSKFAHL